MTFYSVHVVVSNPPSAGILHTYSKWEEWKTAFSSVFNDTFHVPPTTDSSSFGFNSLGGFSFADLAKNTDGFAFGAKGWLQLWHLIMLCLTVLAYRYQYTTNTIIFHYVFIALSFMKTLTSRGQTLERQYLGPQWPRHQKTTATRRVVMKRRLPIMWTFTSSQ